MAGFQMIWNGWDGNDPAAAASARALLEQELGLSKETIAKIFSTAGTPIASGPSEQQLRECSHKLAALGAQVLIVSAPTIVESNEIEFTLAPLSPPVPPTAEKIRVPEQLVIEELDLSLDQPILNVASLPKPPSALSIDAAPEDAAIIPESLRKNSSPSQAIPVTEPATLVLTTETPPTAPSLPSESPTPPAVAADSPKPEEKTDEVIDDTPLAKRRRSAEVAAQAVVEIGGASDTAEEPENRSPKGKFAEYAPIIGGLFFLGLGNFIYFSLQNSDPQPTFIVPKSFEAGAPTKKIAAPPPTAIPEPTATPIIGFPESLQGQEKADHFDTAWQLDFKDDLPSNLTLTLTMPVLGPPTAEELINKVVRRAVRKIEVSDFSWAPRTEVEETPHTGTATARIYISENQQQRRIVGQAQVSLVLDPKTQQARGDFTIATEGTPASIPNGTVEITSEVPTDGTLSPSPAKVSVVVRGSFQSS